MTANLFDDQFPDTSTVPIGPQAVVLRSYAAPQASQLLADLKRVEQTSPFREMLTPGGHAMSSPKTNCGALGWTSDRSGYRYTARDPLTGQCWPPMPASFDRIARDAALAAGFECFAPDSCLINQYFPGTHLGLHQDSDERDHGQPVVTVSLGLPAMFLWSGLARTGKPARVPLFHGDVVVWGGVDRLRYHGIAVLKPGEHGLVGAQRVSLTFRRAG